MNLSPANYNTPQQIVIGGEEKAVDEAVLLLKEKGFKRMIPLNVSGPFHTAILEPAAKKLAKDLGCMTCCSSSPAIVSFFIISVVVLLMIGKEGSEN